MNENNENTIISFVKQSMEKVDAPFFQIKTVDSSNKRFRERVYCYELYHQMRYLQKKNSQMTFDINAEIDKRSHPVIHEPINPDFVFHEQGTMSNNLAVIEVKTALSFNKKNVVKDFTTLRCMVNCYQYQIGIFICIGKSLNDFQSSAILQSVLNIPHISDCKSKIYIIFQKDQGGEIEAKKLGELF